jgi:iron complex transport system permease protein
MHLADGKVPEEYRQYTGKKISFITGWFVVLIVVFVLSISIGAVRIPPCTVVKTLLGYSVTKQFDIIVLNVRLPQALTAVMAGIGLAVAGAAMQSILRNPLGSPFTLGISQAAAFGAAFSVMFLGSGAMHSTAADAVVVSNPYLTTSIAFFFSLVCVGVILLITRLRSASVEVLVLAGIAMGSLFTAGTMFLQYFADDVQLAAMVFWTFGDTSRASWGELAFITAVVLLAVTYFSFNSWNYNAIDAGDETANGLGVAVKRVRIYGMLVASVTSAVIVAFLGIIGFVGLVCPHIVRRIIGDDHRFLIPGTCIMGGILLLSSDTVARIMFTPHVLPVAILTSLIGVPAFVYLLVRGYRR